MANWWNRAANLADIYSDGSNLTRQVANAFYGEPNLNSLGRILSDTANADYRMFEQVANKAKQYENKHWGDEGKKGNHRTTSNHSDSWKFDRIKDYADGKLTEKQLKQIWNLKKDDTFSWTKDTFGNDVYHALPAQLSDPTWHEYMERREAPLGTKYVPVF
jgi:hypothetical protein